MLPCALPPRYSQSILIKTAIALRIRSWRGTHGLKHLLLRSLDRWPITLPPPRLAWTPSTCLHPMAQIAAHAWCHCKQPILVILGGIPP